MSEKQLSTLLARVKHDSALRAKLQSAADLDAAAVIAKQAGYEVSKEDWLDYQSKFENSELTDQELEGVSGGTMISLKSIHGC